ncbi:MAG: nucleotidyltransferase domain-containing protein [Candidatus Marinimicrobia bacterium]|nr:nucleotidyltransferase domain-containing protein [bacterium]MCG2716326.1 nucleotidyltransferase domain-containing protein [Candidatus Neomarinimicrobiota bacterium]
MKKFPEFDKYQISPKRAIKKLKSLFLTKDEIEFAYLFGSYALNKNVTLSDIDVAVFLKNANENPYYQFILVEEIMSALLSNNVDLIVLNNADILLKYQIVSHGLIIKDRPGLRQNFEAENLSRYMDFNYINKIHLIAFKNRIKDGKYFG